MKKLPLFVMVLIVSTLIINLLFCFCQGGGDDSGDKPQPGTPEADSTALVKLFQTMNANENWPDDYRNSWQFLQPMDTWQGVTLTEKRRVVKLELLLSVYENSQIVIPERKGSLPAEIGNLGALEVLVIDAPGVTGTLPHELGELPRLKSLKIVNTGVTGGIPWEIYNLTKLTELEFDNLYSGLTTGLTNDLGKLTKLTRLVLNNQQFTGAFPPRGERLMNLTYLSLRNNRFTGSIPAGMARDELLYIDLSDNELSGEVPADMLDYLNNHPTHQYTICPQRGEGFSNYVCP